MVVGDLVGDSYQVALHPRHGRRDPLQFADALRFLRQPRGVIRPLVPNTFLDGRAESGSLLLQQLPLLDPAPCKCKELLLAVRTSPPFLSPPLAHSHTDNLSPSLPLSPPPLVQLLDIAYFKRRHGTAVWHAPQWCCCTAAYNLQHGSQDPLVRHRHINQHDSEASGRGGKSRRVKLARRWLQHLGSHPLLLPFFFSSPSFPSSWPIGIPPFPPSASKSSDGGARIGDSEYERSAKARVRGAPHCMAGGRTKIRPWRLREYGAENQRRQPPPHLLK